jgi:endonuclease I
VVFSEPVTPLAGAFVLECPAGSNRPFTVDTDDNTTFSIDPDATLPADTDCVFTVNALLVEDRDGTPDSPAQGAIVDFHTAQVTAPVVQSTVPVDGATNFAPAGDIVVSFDMPVTLTAGAFTLTCSQTAGIVLTHANSGAQFQIMTSTALVAGETCTFRIEADNVTSGDGLHPVADTEIDFTVATTGAGAYYATVNTSSPGQLRCTLHQVIDGHTKYPYSDTTTDTWDILEIADEDPNNSGRVLDIYRNESYVKHGAGNNDYNREHTWPNSLGFANQNLAAYTDTHMLYISNDTYNSTRGNTPYGNCTASCTPLVTLPNNGHGGVPGAYPGTSNWYNGQQIFEVWNHRKGDAARAILYMAIRYEGGDGTPNLELTNNLALVDTTPSTAPFAYMGKLDDLIAWHQFDPPDALEMLRNEAVAGFQGNRNPFIDHPEWGTTALFQSTTPAVCQPVQGGGNTAPVSTDDLFQAQQDVQRVVAAPGVLQNDTDAQANPLTAVLVSTTQSGVLVLNSNGGFTYTPNAGFCGTDGFGYQANDGSLSSSTAMVIINVACASIFRNGFED